MAGEVSWGECQPNGALSVPSCKDDNVTYRRLKLLGQGSFGKAFLARDLANDDLCVMKQVRVEKMDVKARDTAVREAVALRRIRHPNVVRFRQVFMRSGWLCLVMDFADGGDLCAAVKERARSGVPFEENAVLECFAQVADAVCYVHLQKMVHRDIKSRNIFLCRTGKALLGDFGLVRLLESTCELANTRVGTPYYLSPEIIRKQPYNYKTDVWSLGVLLYEMAALARPFQGTLETLPKVILKGAYAPLGSHYSQGLHELVAGMLQVDPANRTVLLDALQGSVLAPPLQRSRDALGLEVPQLPESRVKKPAQAPAPAPAPAATQAAAQPLPPLPGAQPLPPLPGAQPLPPLPAAAPASAPASAGHQKSSSEWIGYNTMIRQAGEGPILPAGQAVPEPVPPGGDVPPPLQPSGLDALAASIGPAGGGKSLAASMCPENWSAGRQHDPESGEEDLGSMSSDSWGSVVEGDDPEMQKAITMVNSG